MSAIIEYLQSYENYFWHYEDSGKVIAVPHGHTIGYSEHILQEIIVHLTPYGLPRFGSLLLALAATNSHGIDTLDDILRIVSARTNENEEVDKGIWFAKLLTQLPARYKKGNLRLELLRGIFLSSHNSIGKKRTLSILSELKNNLYLNSYTDILKKASITKEHIINDFKTLGLLGRELDSIAAIMVRLTGLPKIESELEELDLELEESQREEEGLIKELTSNHKTHHVATLISRLISGLHIPFHSSLPSEQPIGGVADITNKGSFDKLLMSEHAYDDHILMSRLANDESLFHHREAPPADNNYSRVILIDNSLKNWGTIRTISFATMLAITNHPKNKNPCRVFLVGKSYKEIGFASVHEIIDAMHILDYSLDPGIGLMELFSNEQIKLSEIFFIGSMESLERKGMQLFSAELGKRVDHWLHPNVIGEITVYKNPRRGKRLIQELKLPLKELWTKHKNKTQEIANYEGYEYPILFPHSKFKTNWQGERYVYAVTKNKALLRYYGERNTDNQGWEIVTSKFLRRDSLKAVMTHKDLSTTALVCSQDREYALIQYPSGQRTPVQNSRFLKSAKHFVVDDAFFKFSSHSIACYIDLKGYVSENASEIKVKESNQLKRYSFSVYQNIRRIYITEEGQLRIGKQDLALNRGHVFLMHNGSKSACKIEATQTSIGIYSFPEGSTIRHNSDGILTLISANKAIPKIYVPCVLNTPLGLATEDKFSGHTYYQLKHKVEILLTGESSNKLAIIKLVKGHLGNVTLKSAKEMVDSRLINSTDEMKILSIKEELDEMNVSYTIRKRGKQQDVLKPIEFYNRYIKYFLNHIVSHGTNAN